METEDECVLRFCKINMAPVKHALETGATVQRRQDSEAVGDSVNVALSKEIRVYRNCCCQQNMPIQLALSITGVAITGGNGTLIVNRQAAV